MGCCGKNRITQAELDAVKIPPMQAATGHAGLRFTRPQMAPAMQPGAGSVSVRYMENSTIVARGPVTGRKYAFSRANPVQSVDARDAAALLNTRYFRPA